MKINVIGIYIQKIFCEYSNMILFCELVIGCVYTYCNRPHCIDTTGKAKLSLRSSGMSSLCKTRKGSQVQTKIVLGVVLTYAQQIKLVNDIEIKLIDTCDGRWGADEKHCEPHQNHEEKWVHSHILLPKTRL